MSEPLRPVSWRSDPPAVLLLDQTRLPHEESVLVCETVDALVDAIRRLVVRGAPLLGIAGAYGVALAAARGDDVPAAARRLDAARPTAVNLGRGVERAAAAHLHAGGDPAAALAEARTLAAEDAQACEALAYYGLAFVPKAAHVLTHCNSGRLVSAGRGTAFGVIEMAHEQGRVAQLWIGETRPLLQGARLTAWEARRSGIPYAVITDSAAGSLFAQGLVDVVLVGADRIAADGSVANKIGTFGLAVLAYHHRVPFVVVAPTATIDLQAADGAAIPVEQRPAEEVTGTAAPPGSAAHNPAFDVTPAELVTALVTERGVVQPVGSAGIRHLLDLGEPTRPRR